MKTAILPILLVIWLLPCRAESLNRFSPAAPPPPDTITLWWDTVNTCNGNQVEVSCYTRGFDSVYSVSLAFFFNKFALTYAGIYLSPGLTFSSVNNTNYDSLRNRVILGAFSITSPITIPDSGVLMRVTFLADSSATLDWDTINYGYAQVTNLAGQTIPLIQKNGLIDAGPCTRISGFARYDNAPASPIANTLVILKMNGSPMDQSVTDSSGYYEFNITQGGNYSLELSPVKPWGGGNAVDALLVMKHFAGISNLSGLKLGAADVDTTGSVNANDALLLAQRFVGMIATFFSGDWLSETIPLNIPVPGTPLSISQDIKAICFGDVDGSHIP